MKEQKLDEKRLKLEGEVVVAQGRSHKSLSKHKSFRGAMLCEAFRVKIQIKRQRKFAKQLVLVGELSSDTLLKSGMKLTVEWSLFTFLIFSLPDFK